ncbi:MULTISPECIES: BRO-N domain-containing protein [Clostridium]|uniref:BRO-N domain-containing protein n=1 Tax=Clostridium TaxID=1485 RepID=UPI000824DE22|nr:MULTISPECIES: BRO family protein [Clostridium]PJI08323.1 transporter [Clostridium sp. CT7]
MENKIKIFKNDLFEIGVKLDNDEWVFDVEKVALSLGITTVAKSGNVCVRWSRVNKYLSSSPQVGTLKKGDFIPEPAVYKLAFKASNELAEQFQDWLAVDVLPKINHTGGYVNNDDLFVETYLPFADENTRLVFKNTLSTVRKQNQIISLQKSTIDSQGKQIEHKDDVIGGLVDKITLAEKRQVLNRVVRYKGADFQKRWRELYRQFEMKYHLNLNNSLEKYNSTHKPKLKNKVDYIDKVMSKIPELYEIACKLYEDDVKELAENLYSLCKEA